VTVLAIATSTPQVGVALAGTDGVMGSVKLLQGRRHGETLAPAIDSLTRLCGASLDELTLVAVDYGPGLFTGLRVGVATAKAIASALDVPLAGCTSLYLLAHPHLRLGRPVVSVVDARRGEVFWALYEPSGDSGRQIAVPSVSKPEELGAQLGAAVATGEHGRLLVAGDGARRYASVLTACAGVEIAPPEFDHPCPEVLAGLAPSLEAGPAGALVPLYLRGADVRIGWDQRDG
jgi:tRNA threonylcarbamoyladenosine biosynthesis protein TsaB